MPDNLFEKISPPAAAVFGFGQKPELVNKKVMQLVEAGVHNWYAARLQFLDVHIVAVMSGSASPNGEPFNRNGYAQNKGPSLAQSRLGTMLRLFPPSIGNTHAEDDQYPAEDHGNQYWLA